jgi:hypothetical protein
VGAATIALADALAAATGTVRTLGTASIVLGGVVSDGAVEVVREQKYRRTKSLLVTVANRYR